MAMVHDSHESRHVHHFNTPHHLKDVRWDRALTIALLTAFWVLVIIAAARWL